MDSEREYYRQACMNKLPKPKDRVRAGANLLRKHDPAWYNKIDLSIFGLEEEILIQLFGDFSKGCELLGLDHWWGASTDGSIFGFVKDHDDADSLVPHWRSFIERLKKENAPCTIPTS